MTYRIPFNKPSIAGRELYYVAEAVLSGHTSGNGPFTRRCEATLSELLDNRRVLLTTSCTAALEMAALLLDLDEGDEVILPSYTFVSTANAFRLRGARLRFADIRPDTLNLDERHVAELASERTAAIVPVHYAGVSCEMDVLGEIASQCGAAIVEDAAHALDAKYRGAPLGTLSDLGTLSFHETKNLTCGEGGALIVNDDKLAERAEILREKGTNRAQFFRGQVDKYTWVDVGSSYIPSDLLAAFLLGQLERLEQITAARGRVFEAYHEALEPLESRGCLRRPVLPPDRESSYHMYYLLLSSGEERDRLIDYLRERGILAVFHYIPLHTSPVGQSLGGAAGQLPVTESVSERLIRLPFYNDLGMDEIDEVVAAVTDFFGRE